MNYVLKQPIREKITLSPTVGIIQARFGKSQSWIYKNASKINGSFTKFSALDTLKEIFNVENALDLLDVLPENTSQN